MATFLDKVIFLLLIILTITSFLFIKRLLYQGNLVRISSDNKTVYILPLTEDRIVSVKTRNRENVIEIKDKRVRMREASCPDKLCVKQGWIERGAIICLPNRVVVTVGGDEGKERYDAVTK